MPLYFAYGSNLLLSQIRKRTENKNLKPILYEPGRKDNAYELKEIEVVKLDGSKVKVVTYIANKEGSFQPSKKYMEKIIQGAKECGLPEEYIGRLKKIRTK